jgi:hypothetical protein
MPKSSQLSHTRRLSSTPKEILMSMRRSHMITSFLWKMRKFLVGAMLQTVGVLSIRNQQYLSIRNQQYFCIVSIVEYTYTHMCIYIYIIYYFKTYYHNAGSDVLVSSISNEYVFKFFYMK